MKLLRLAAIGLLIYVSVPLNSQTNNDSSTVLTKAQIRERAMRITGFASLYTIESIKDIALSHVNVPFLADSLNQKNGFELTFSIGKLILPSTKETDRQPTRHFVALLKADGQLVNITSQLPERPEEIHAEPPPK